MTPKLEMTDTEVAEQQANLIEKTMRELREKLGEFNPLMTPEVYHVAIFFGAREVEVMGMRAAEIGHPLIINSSAHPILMMALFMQCMKDIMEHGEHGNVPKTQKH